MLVASFTEHPLFRHWFPHVDEAVQQQPTMRRLRYFRPFVFFQYCHLETNGARLECSLPMPNTDIDCTLLDIFSTFHVCYCEPWAIRSIFKARYCEYWVLSMFEELVLRVLGTQYVRGVTTASTGFYCVLFWLYNRYYEALSRD